MAEELRADRAWQHPWLRIERALRIVIGARLTHSPSDARDRALLAVIVARRKLERAGWFN